MSRLPQLLADENFPGDVVEALTMMGYNVAWIHRDAPGSSDEEVLERAVKEERILLTFDKDFGELAFKRGLPASCGIMLFRIPLLSPQNLVIFIKETLKSRNDWIGNFSVVEMMRIRMRTISK